MKNVRDSGLSRKRDENAGSGPPLPDPVLTYHQTTTGIVQTSLDNLRPTIRLVVIRSSVELLGN